MSTTNGNEPAFPRPIGSSPAGDISSEYEGMTKREYFAGLAMQGMAANSHDNCPHDKETMSRYSVEFADALLAELSKEQT